MLKKLDETKKTLIKHHLTITDYTFHNSDGITGKMSHHEDCLNCGKTATTVFTKDEKTREGIISASVRITLCHDDFMRYTKLEEGKFRSDMWSLGLTKHLAGGE